MDIFSGLNDAQKEAVEATEGPVMIVAGAGAGKTKTITHRIMNLVQKGIAPSEILAITFTNKAAKEMRERVEKMVPAYLGVPYVSTFHSLGVAILRAHAQHVGRTQSFTIFDHDDTISLTKQCIIELGLDPKQHEPKKIHSIISRMKGDCVSVADYASNTETHFGQTIASVWERYEKKLHEGGGFDFDDLLVKTVELLKKHPEIRESYQKRFRYVHVDEYQDTNEVQYELVKLLVGPEKNICVVGDTDQNIYSWRGAKIKNMLHFERDFPGAKVLFLEQNYRSTKTILHAANKVIEKNTVRVPKNLFTENADGELIKVYEAMDERDEAEFVVERADEFVEGNIMPEDIAVLYRANFQSRVLEEAFLAKGLPYQVLGTRFYERKEVKDLLAYLRAAGNPNSFADLKRALSFPTRGIGKVTLTEILSGRRDSLKGATKMKVDSFFAMLARIDAYRQSHAPSDVIRFTMKESGIEEALKTGGPEELERLENLQELASLAVRYDATGPEGLTQLLDDAALQSEQDSLNQGKGGIRLMTVHAAKGLEFQKVFVVGLEQGLFPHDRDTNTKTEDREEERRLFYVALTRAKEEAILTYARMRTLFGMREMTMPSEFLYDIPAELTAQDMRKGRGRETVVYID
jgi:DNA helicase-2/ATP-dependent DNA helicase PcrA